MAISRKAGEDRLFLAAAKIEYKDQIVAFSGRLGFARRGGPVPLRLMVADGEIGAGGITLTSVQPAALLYDGKSITVFCPKDAPEPRVTLAPNLRGVKVQVVRE